MSAMPNEPDRKESRHHLHDAHFKRIEQTLDEIQEGQRAQSKILDKHTETLQSHTGMLQSHTETLQVHTDLLHTNIDRLEDLADGQTAIRTEQSAIRLDQAAQHRRLDALGHTQTETLRAMSGMQDQIVDLQGGVGRILAILDERS